MRDLQRSLSLRSQIQILLSEVGPQLPDFKLEKKQHHILMSYKHGQKSVFYSWGPVTQFITKPLQTGDSKYSVAELGCESQLLMLSPEPIQAVPLLPSSKNNDCLMLVFYFAQVCILQI